MGKLVFCLELVVLVVLVPVLAIRFQRLDDHSPIIQLFQWPWRDVTRLCNEQFRNLSGMVALQVSPPQPHRIINQPLRNRSIKRPWWERYQPTGLRIGKTRSGTVAEFEEMIRTCNDHGIPIYTEIIINHLLASDAGVGRDSNGDWYSVDEVQRTLQVNGIFADILISSTEACPKGFRANSTFLCHPVAPYTFEDAPLLKLNMTKDTVIQKVVSLFDSLSAFGIRGVSIVSADLSDIASLMSVLTATNQENNDTFVYFEVRSEPTITPSRAAGELTYFSPAMAAEMRSVIRNGATQFEVEGSSMYGGTANFYYILQTNEQLLTFQQARIIGFEHHEISHDSTYRQWGYPEFVDLSLEQNVVATVLLLFTTPNMGIPRIVWDYESTGQDWEGPPRFNNLTVVSTFEELSGGTAGIWDQRFPMRWNEWIAPILTFRSQWMGSFSLDSGQFPYASATHSGILLKPDTSTTNSTPIAAFIMLFDKYRLPAENVLMGSAPENCIVGILLVPTFVNSTPEDVRNAGSANTIQSGMSYLLKSDRDVEGFHLTSGTLCGSSLISHTVLGEQDCVELTSIPEENEDFFTTEIRFTAGDNQHLPFLLFIANATGASACY